MTLQQKSGHTIRNCGPFEENPISHMGSIHATYPVGQDFLGVHLNSHEVLGIPRKSCSGISSGQLGVGTLRKPKEPKGQGIQPKKHRENHINQNKSSRTMSFGFRWAPQWVTQSHRTLHRSGGRRQSDRQPKTERHGS